MSWDKYVANYGFVLKKPKEQQITPEQKAKEIETNRAKALSIVEMDKRRKRKT